MFLEMLWRRMDTYERKEAQVEKPPKTHHEGEAETHTPG